MAETKLTVIDMSGISPYVSIEKQLLLDAEKYIKRAEMYLIVGKLRHCLGCLIKAAKKYDKANSHMLAMDGLSKALLQPMLSGLSNKIANDILNLKA